MHTPKSRRRVGAVGALTAIAAVVGLFAAPPAVAASAAPATDTAPVAASTTPTAAVDDTGSRFTLAVLPDTQFYSRYSASQFYPRYGTDPFKVQTEWLVENQEELNIPFVVHVGDVVDQVGQAGEWDAADRAMNVLEAGGLGYSIIPGNHDVTDQNARSSTGISGNYLSRFSTAQVSTQPEYIASYQNGLSTAYIFEVEGQKFMSLALAWNASADTFTWAQGVLNAHPTVPVILSSHAIINIAADQVTPADWWFGEDLWNALIRKNDQIFLTFNGHFHGATARTRENDFGRDVLQVLTDYQMAADGGNGYLTLVEFDLEGKKLDVETVSPWITKKAPETISRDDTPVLDGPWQSFSYEMDFAERFASFDPGFAPGTGEYGDLSERGKAIVSEGWSGSPVGQTPLPGSREDYPVIDGTLAHWRFGDLAEGTFDETMSVSDVAGSNELHRLPSAQTDPADQPGDVRITKTDVAPFSSDGAASCFTASRTGNRLSYLLTDFGSDVTKADLDGGYTIESFVKMDKSWTADENRWSGWLSRAGKRSALPLTWGGDMEGAPAFFSVSNLREFQWGISPGTDWQTPTSLWSGEIMVDQWHHVAVVNDPEANTTIMYVDGVPVLRNASNMNGMMFQDGQPWVMGSWWGDDEPTGGWNGCIGETRIIDHAVEPSQFLTERASIDADAADFRVFEKLEGVLPADTEITSLSGLGHPGAEVRVQTTRAVEPVVTTLELSANVVTAGLDEWVASASAPAGTATVAADGRWSLELAEPLAGSGRWDVTLMQKLGERDGRSLERSFSIADPDPISVVPAAVTFVDLPSTAGDSYTIPAVTGVEYLVDGAVIAAGTYAGTGEVTVTARAVGGYAFPAGAQVTWAFAFTNVTVPSPSPTPTDAPSPSPEPTDAPSPSPTPTDGASPSPSPTTVPSPQPTPAPELPAGAPSAPSGDDLTDANRGSLDLPATVVAGQTVVGEVDAEFAGQTMWGWMYSTPVALGSAMVNAVGELRLAVPAAVDPGEHRVAVVLADGTLVGWDTITVLAADGSLPATGGVISGIWLAIALLGAGAIAVFLVRRRRRTA